METSQAALQKIENELREQRELNRELLLQLKLVHTKMAEMRSSRLSDASLALESCKTEIQPADPMLSPQVKALLDLYKTTNANANTLFEINLGKYVLKNSTSLGKLISLPFRVNSQIKLQKKQQTPSVFGEDFSSFIKTYEKGGDKAVDNLVMGIDTPPRILANAYTALAKHLRKTDKKAAYNYARKAWDAEPVPWRLKWLAFRAFDSGDAVSARAMLAMLPDNITVSTGEKQKASQIMQSSACKPVQSERSSLETETARKKVIAENLRLQEEKDSLIKEAREKDRKISSLQQMRDMLLNEKNIAEKKAEMVEENVKRLSDAQALLGAFQNELMAIRKARNGDAIVIAGWIKLARELEEQKKILASKLDDAEKSLDTSRKVVDELESRNKELLAQSAAMEQMCATIQESQSGFLKQLFEAEKNHVESITQKVDSITREVRMESENIMRLQKNYTNKAVDRILSYAQLDRYFRKGELPGIAPWDTGWAACPDFALAIVDLLSTNVYDLIIEFGSGQTTLVIARSILEMNRKRPDDKLPAFASFEHLEEFYHKTLQMLVEAGVDGHVNLNLAPLVDYCAPDNTNYKYYDCGEKLAELGHEYGGHGQKILAIIDGPPGSTCAHARYPAFPLLMGSMQGASIDFLMDDVIRDEEREIGQLWESACKTAGVNYSFNARALEKGAILLRVER